MFIVPRSSTVAELAMSAKFKTFSFPVIKSYSVVSVFRSSVIPRFPVSQFFHNAATKLLWLFLQPLFYSLRPLFVQPKPLTMLRSEPVLPAFLAAAEYVIAVNILRLCVSAATAAVKFKVSLFCEQWILVHK